MNFSYSILARNNPTGTNSIEEVRDETSITRGPYDEFISEPTVGKSTRNFFTRLI